MQTSKLEAVLRFFDVAKGSLQKKSVTFFTLGGGWVGSRSVFVTLFFSSKTWSKMA